MNDTSRPHTPTQRVAAIDNTSESESQRVTAIDNTPAGPTGGHAVVTTINQVQLKNASDVSPCPATGGDVNGPASGLPQANGGFIPASGGGGGLPPSTVAVVSDGVGDHEIVSICEPTGLSTAQAEEFHAQHGYNEVVVKQTPEWKKIVWRYLDWVSIVIIAAAVISVAVTNEGSRGWTSFTLLLIELNLIVWVGYYTERNAGNAVKELEELSAPHAVVLRDGKWIELPVKELCLGDVIQLKGGDVIPADAKLIGQGEPLKIDESSLTGESMAVSRGPGDEILSGAVVAQGELDAVVAAIGANTFFGKTIKLLGGPEEKGHLQVVLGRVSLGLGLVATMVVIAILVVLLARGDPVGFVITYVFVILVSVVPIGMPVVTGAVLAVGAREMAAEKAIVSRLSALEELSGMEVLASDKTGTLTLNRLTLDPAEILPWDGFSSKDVLMLASLSAKWEHQDAIDSAITSVVGGDQSLISNYTINRFIPFNPVDKKTVAYVSSSTGESFVAAKGAPQIIGDLLTDQTAKDAVDSYIEERGRRGLRALGVARSVDDGVSWHLVGCIALLDPPREDSAETIRLAQDLGVQVKMVTGDQLAIAIETSRRLGLGTNIMEGKELMYAKGVDLGLARKVDMVDGFAGVYPEHKYRIVEALQAKGRLVGMTGDGVNDAPALKQANVGIAVAGATEAAKGAADIILTQEGISTIITAIIRSRKIFQRLQAYVMYRMASSLLILGFFFFSSVIIGFELPTWVLVLISLTNDLSVMATSLDKVHSSDHPELWNMTKNLAVALAIATVGAMGTMLYLCLISPDILNWWHWYNTSLDDTPGVESGITNGQVIACMYLCLTALIQLNILSTRNPSFWWRFGKHSAPRPALLLLLPVTVFLIAATFIAVYWPDDVQPDGGRSKLDGAGWLPIAVTWFYIIVWFFLADFAKYLVLRVFNSYEKSLLHAKTTEEQPPGWVHGLDAMGRYTAAAFARMDQMFTTAWYRVLKRIGWRKGPDRPLSQRDVQRDMSQRLSYRDIHGHVPEDVMVPRVPSQDQRPPSVVVDGQSHATDVTMEERRVKSPDIMRFSVY